MKKNRIEEPDWERLVGETEEASWVADRDRKFGLMGKAVGMLQKIADELEKRGALYSCSPEILREIPEAADWYVSLAGYALKTLGNISELPRSYGLTRSPKAVVGALRSGANVADADLKAFCRWINAELNHLHPKAIREKQRTLLYCPWSSAGE